MKGNIAVLRALAIAKEDMKEVIKFLDQAYSGDIDEIDIDRERFNNAYKLYEGFLHHINSAIKDVEQIAEIVQQCQNSSN